MSGVCFFVDAIPTCFCIFVKYFVYIAMDVHGNDQVRSN